MAPGRTYPYWRRAQLTTQPRSGVLTVRVCCYAHILDITALVLLLCLCITVVNSVRHHPVLPRLLVTASGDSTIHIWRCPDEHHSRRDDVGPLGSPGNKKSVKPHKMNVVQVCCISNVPHNSVGSRCWTLVLQNNKMMMKLRRSPSHHALCLLSRLHSWN